MRRYGVVVVAALIWREGSLLIAQRKKDASHPLKWEFPGGKVERGETPREALERELEEELCIQANVGKEVIRYEYSYPGKAPLLLIFCGITEFHGEPQNLVFEQIRWEKPANLPDYDFLDGDKDIVDRLARGGL
ncbi:MAG TPA: NUDIX domain-containing protein [Bryobacteraceae bacterium]|nr:NUDIX domain-containing protein [Bryobacteraceae bacterium]